MASAALCFHHSYPGACLSSAACSSAHARDGSKASMAKIAIPRMAFSLHNIEGPGLNGVVVIARRVLDRLIGLGLADPVGGAGGE
jgi:hypothetical protein